MGTVKIDPKVLEIVKYNQMADQNGFPHPNAHIFAQIQAELERLEKLANQPAFAYVDVDSSNVAVIGWATTPDAHTGTLRVKFKNGGVYDYKDVPKTTYQLLMLAESKGSFLAKNIRDQFPTERVE